MNKVFISHYTGCNTHLHRARKSQVRLPLHAQVVDMPGHNSSLFVLGVMILWFGWYGFNPGSQLVLINSSNAIANAAVTTTIAPALASMSALMTKATLGKFKMGGSPSPEHTSAACA